MPTKPSADLTLFDTLKNWEAKTRQTKSLRSPAHWY
jgi:hypothetical protein